MAGRSTTWIPAGVDSANHKIDLLLVQSSEIIKPIISEAHIGQHHAVSIKGRGHHILQAVSVIRGVGLVKKVPLLFEERVPETDPTAS